MDPGERKYERRIWIEPTFVVDALDVSQVAVLKGAK